MNEFEYRRKIANGEFDKGADEDNPARGPEDPVSVAAREKGSDAADKARREQEHEE
jgi:hypothetical protein